MTYRQKIDTLKNYMGFAIRSNPGNLEGMKQSVSAVLDHVASTDSNPMHDQCPDDLESWCKFKLDKDNYKHRHGLPLPVRDFIRPVFKDLANEELLKKCLHGKMQNANECLNKLIWDRCNKETYVAVPVIEDATYSAVAYFNDGASSILMVMRELGIEPGDTQHGHAVYATKCASKTPTETHRNKRNNVEKQ